MTEEEKREHATRIAEETLRNFEFLSVHEDQELESLGASDDDIEDIYEYITDGTVLIG